MIFREDEKFIQAEITRILREGIIEAKSPWRAQILITSAENRKKKRMVIDHSQTIKRFTQLDAYPLPNIDKMVGKIAKYKILNTRPQKRLSQYKPYTAFEVCEQLYQFLRIPFDVTNGVASFQRIIHKIITDERLQGTYAYIDKVTACSYDRNDPDRHLKRFRRRR